MDRLIIGRRLVVAWAFTCVASAQTSPPSATDEERLWAEVETLRRACDIPTTQPNHLWFTNAAANRHDLLHRIELYQALYPGGAHRDEALRLELATRFEIAALTDASFQGLHERVSLAVKQPASESMIHEAEYWKSLTSLLAGDLREPADAEARKKVHAMWRSYMDRFPKSERTPGLAAILIDSTVTQNAFELPVTAPHPDELQAMRRELEQLHALLTSAFPEHMETARLTGVIRRWQTLGEPFRFTCNDAETHLTPGQGPIWIVAWASHNRASANLRARARRDADRRNVRVLEVNLDADNQPSPAEENSTRELRSRSRCAGRFLDDWGIRRLPTVFLLNAEGRLVATGEGPAAAALLDRQVR